MDALYPEKPASARTYTYRSRHRPGHASRSAGQAGSPSGATDPVCGMGLDPWETQYALERGGVTYRFCSSECKQTFLLFPDRFGKGAAGSV